MLRKLVSMLAVAGFVLSAAGAASAGVFLPRSSEIVYKLGGLPSITVTGTYGGGGWASVSNNGSVHDLSDTTGIWNTAANSPGTSLFTGVALITDLLITLENNSGSFAAGFSAANSVAGNLTNSRQSVYSGTVCPDGCLGGTETISGQNIIIILGNPLIFQNDILGIGGTGTVMVGQAVIAATGGPFVTGKVKITNITSNVVQLPGRQGPPSSTPAVRFTGLAFTLDPTSMEEIKTFTTLEGFVTSHPAGILKTNASVTLKGTNTLGSASAGGAVTLVTPLRIDTGPLAVGNIPGKMTKTFVFVPEPGTMLLLASGAAGLVILGRRRSRK
jgi:hypothetical protein